MSIRTIRDSANKLTEHIVTGVVTDEEMFACQTEFFKKVPSLLELWDMSGADLSQITTDGMREFVGRAARLGEARKGGRTAVIVKSPLQFGLGRMAVVFGELFSLPFAFRLFKQRADAVDWLKEGL